MRFVIVFLLLASCAPPALQSPSLLFVEEQGTITVLFNRQTDAHAALMQYLEKTTTAQCAIYDLGDTKLAASLSQHRLITDTDSNIPGDYVDKGSALMHNKFCVLDNQIVWTGSLNPTTSGFAKNDNNMLFINSTYFAANYAAEYAELESQILGKTRKHTPTPYPHILLSGILLENYFCPEDACEQQVLRTLNMSNVSIHFMTFSFTSDPIGQLLVQKHRSDVKIYGIFESRGQSQYSEYKPLLAAGINVSLDGNPAAMHHKVFIIDNKIVITGSYNPTNNGNKNNDENLLIIHDTHIAAQYLGEFERVAGFAITKSR